ncbi:Hypothetical protein CINCED_3A015493 [Cinara cedri]|uniref:Mos1 transposase HTH domain-containing protein n=1 Tax=Cinara cedri TaxID=506608 RepID=A0A5E4MJP2_9HEMI|nr:Hypothetical protein CINCED_3A015493 [Cinara cedri]
MCDEKQGQRINLKFLVKLKKTPTECYKLLQEAYGGNSLSRARVFERYKRFGEGRESTEDDQRPGRPVTQCHSLSPYRRMSIRMIAEAVNADKETVRKILHEELHTTKVCAKSVPKNLTPDQKFLRQQVCSDFLEKLKEDPGLMKNIKLATKRGFFNTMLKHSDNRCIGRHPNRPESKKRGCPNQNLRQCRSFFFNINGIVMGSRGSDC